MNNIIKKKGRSKNDPLPQQAKLQLGEEFYINLTNRLTIIIITLLIIACIGLAITIVLSPKEEAVSYLKDALKIISLVGGSFIAGFGWGYKFKKD